MGSRWEIERERRGSGGKESRREGEQVGMGTGNKGKKVSGSRK
jgi:hypothetical protein